MNIDHFQSNEATAILQSVIPYLQSCGISVDEMVAEKNFFVKFGHNTYRFDSSEQLKDRSTGRSDILITRDGKNLLMVEAKRPGLELTTDDRDQGISYARLLDQIAPFVLVTNSKDFQLFETISKKRLSDHELKILGKEGSSSLTPTLSPELLDEALSLFLRLSEDNVRAIAKSFMERTLSVYSTSISGAPGKFIAEAFVPRSQLLARIRTFLGQNQKTIFPVIAESGQGKSCELCGIASHLTNEKEVVFFFNGIQLEGNSLIKSLHSEMAWSLRDVENEVKLCARLNRIFSDTGLTIIIDAVDEWTSENKVSELVRLAEKFSGSKVKFIISSKPSDWKREILSRKGEPTGIHLHCYNGSQDENLEDSIIPNHTDKEFHLLFSRYRKFFGYSGSIEPGFIEKLRSNLFLLRIAFEAAGNSKIQHLDYSIQEVYEDYITQTVKASQNSDVATRTLTEIAKLFYESSSASISQERLCDGLTIKPTDALPKFLFDRRILEQANGQRGVEYHFYFDKIRDYLIYSRVLSLQSLSPVEWADQLNTWKEDERRFELLSFAYELGSLDQKKAFDGELRLLLINRLKAYRSFIQQDFVKRIFPPFSTEEIGIAAVSSLKFRQHGLQGYRSIENGDEELEIFLRINPLDYPYLRNVKGGWTSATFPTHKTDPASAKEAILEEDILPQLEKRIKQGNLDESSNPEMLRDLLFDLINERFELKPILNIPENSRLTRIGIQNLKSLIRKECWVKHYEHEIKDRKFEEGNLNETWNSSGGYTYSLKLTVEELDWIEKKAEESMENMSDDVVRGASINLTQIQEWILESEATLVAEYGDVITESDLYSKHYEYRVFDPHTNLTDAEIGAYFIQRLSTFLENYVLILEKNFPTTCHLFPLYECLPVHIYFTMDRNRFCNSNRDGEISLHQVWTKISGEKVNNQATYCSDRELRTTLEETGSKSFYKDKELENSFMITRTREYQKSSKPELMHRSHSTPNLRSSWLRQKVYEQVQEDFNEAKSEIRDFLIGRKS